MSASDACDRATCPLCGARIPYLRRVKAAMRARPADAVKVRCKTCRRLVQGRRKAYRWPIVAVAFVVLLPPPLAIAIFAEWPERRLMGLMCLMPVWATAACLAGICLLAGCLRFTHAANADLCRKCGYDLRGSPGPICPECGTERLPPSIEADDDA